MAHFAKVLNGKVKDVMVAEPEFFDNFVDETAGEWIQTSYNTRGGVHYEPNTNTPSEDQSKALRYNYAFIGGNYDKEQDAFYNPQPYDSWVLNENFEWKSPIGDMPNDGNNYTWNEPDQVWEQMSE